MTLKQSDQNYITLASGEKVCILISVLHANQLMD